jgi:enoyl-CoA hydratase/carnithine racemase
VVAAGEEQGMNERDRSTLDDQAPMILRRMPPERRHLAHAMTGHPVDSPAGTWWELVDAAAAADLRPAGIALTRAMPDGSVTVSALRAGHADAVGALSELLRALTAVLRGHAVDTVIVRSTDPAVVRALLACGFTAADDCYLLAL